ncbi:MAG TPA: hypothetical protein PKN99_04345, partial [Cyclobacteriaceae bacterium]|nr:hypothetical protein [Cyclobacteriaceae bacterium]
MELETDNQLINSCLRKIEDRLGWGGSNNWSTQEFESLSQKIQEATGIALSVATLKRLWGKVQYTSRPNVTTLNALAQYLGHENWQVFKQKILIEGNNGHAIINPPNPFIKPGRGKLPTFLASTIGVLIIGVLAFYFYPNSKSKLVDPAKFQFSSKKVVDEGVPNTVVFDYDASAASPEDSVFIQQSWDKRLSTRVDKDQRQHTSIYYHPGFFEAKLRINQIVVKKHNLFITTKGWTSMIETKPVPVYFREEDVNTNGQLGITAEQILSNNIP